MKQLKGFTLLEMVLVIAVLSIISVMASKPLTQGYQTYLSSTNAIKSDWQARYALERMVRELRSTSTAGGITTATSSSITFTDINLHSITYALSGTSLVRTDSQGLNSAQILADGIKTLTFIYYDSAGSVISTPIASPITTVKYVKITLQVTLNGSNFSATTTAFLRRYGY
jgi:prepilin-type N-terminal cleavage/methylation domain-containing protein